jgi:hypothetical protein
MVFLKMPISSRIISQYALLVDDEDFQYHSALDSYPLDRVIAALEGSKYSVLDIIAQDSSWASARTVTSLSHEIARYVTCS